MGITSIFFLSRFDFSFGYGMCVHVYVCVALYISDVALRDSTAWVLMLYTERVELYSLTDQSPMEKLRRFFAFFF